MKSKKVDPKEMAPEEQERWLDSAAKKICWSSEIEGIPLDLEKTKEELKRKLT